MTFCVCLYKLGDTAASPSLGVACVAMSVLNCMPGGSGRVAGAHVGWAGLVNGSHHAQSSCPVNPLFFCCAPCRVSAHAPLSDVSLLWFLVPRAGSPHRCVSASPAVLSVAPLPLGCRSWSASPLRSFRKSRSACRCRVSVSV